MDWTGLLRVPAKREVGKGCYFRLRHLVGLALFDHFSPLSLIGYLPVARCLGLFNWIGIENLERGGTSQLRRRPELSGGQA